MDWQGSELDAPLAMVSTSTILARSTPVGLNFGIRALNPISALLVTIRDGNPGACSITRRSVAGRDDEVPEAVGLSKGPSTGRSRLEDC
jgi:hypothetical protein